MEYLKTKQFVEGRSKGYSNYDEIESLLRLKSDANDGKQAELGKEIKEVVNSIDKGSSCNIRGSKELIDLYNSFDDEKMDLTIPLSDINFVGFFHDNQMILNIDDWNAIGTYSFTSNFLDSLFSLNKFSTFCFSHNEKDLLSENISKLMITQKNQFRQYRFLKEGESWLLRGLTSVSYKNYDNNIAIYLALHSLHNYAEAHNVVLYVENGYISDSNIDITFKQEGKYKIDKNISVEIGIRLTNNELTEGKLSMEFIYFISDNKNHKFKAIGDTVVGINHSFKAVTIDQKLNNLKELSKYTDEIIHHISSIKNINKLDRDQLYVIFNKLSRAKNSEISSASREKIDNLYKDEVTDNTYSLIELFGKISSIDTTINEKTFIQSVFNDLISSSL